MSGPPWQKITFGVGCCLVLVGLGPLILVIWQASQSQALSVPVTLEQGRFRSPYFRTYLLGDYQIDLEGTPQGTRYPSDEDTLLDIYWRVVDSKGKVIQQGTSVGTPITLGGDFRLGLYRSRFGQRQQLEIQMEVRRGVVWRPIKARLEVGQPERSLDISFAFPELLIWAVTISGFGIVVLVYLKTRGSTD